MASMAFSQPLHICLCLLSCYAGDGVKTLSSSANVTYICERKTCTWYSEGEEIDWGYFTKKDGNCSSCIDMCDNHLGCQAVECEGDYCSWWKNDKCVTPNADSSLIQTCVKNTTSKGIKTYYLHAW